MAAGDRIAAVRRALGERRLDALLVTSITNVQYLTGFTGSTGAALVTDDRALMLVDSRYTLQAAQECPLFEIREFSGDIMAAAAGAVEDSGAVRVGFEESGITYAQYISLRRALRQAERCQDGRGRRLLRAGDIVDRMRLVKDPEEIALIRRAVEISDLCFSDLLTWLKPGIREREAALQIEVCMRRHGADKPAFESIVAAGPHSAFPHARPGDARIKAGQLLKLDFGAEYRQYPSDLTRTVALAKATARQKEIYRIVLDAQLRAIDAIRPGVPGRDIDAVARDYISAHGYGGNFGHGLGHSLGRGVHDGPGLSKTSEVVLEAGMVMTVEPGIYIEGWGGVRIEDDVVVTDTGCEVLNRAPKMELIVL